MDLDSEPKLISFFTQVVFSDKSDDPKELIMNIISVIIKIIPYVRSMDLDSQPKPESKLMSLVTRANYLLNSMDLDSLPKPLFKLISLISTKLSIDTEDLSLLEETLELKPVPEIISLFYQIFSLAIYMDSGWNKQLISLRPQAYVGFGNGTFAMYEISELSDHHPFECIPSNWRIIKSDREYTNLFLCRGCKGKCHEEYEHAPVEIKHRIHPKHSLQLVFKNSSETRGCYCCDEDLLEAFYYCKVCDFAVNVACVQKPPILAIDNPRRHEHTLSLFPRLVSLTCNVCALANSSLAIYMCPPCDFFVHPRCINLPRVIRISRHPHRISFTLSFDQRERCCGVCREKIDNDYGCYSCIKEGCWYAAHSRCATQKNVWDGIELEGEPEDIEEEEEELEPFVPISDGIIQHFSHEQHHLLLNDNADIDYDENKQCQACVTPIYFGSFYSCMHQSCDFILHEKCANLSRKIRHPIHPHILTLVGGCDGVMNIDDKCAACPVLCLNGFFYECRGCGFKLNVQCATISEPLVSKSHVHPLFLTSKPGEVRFCSICHTSRSYLTLETFNCIEGDCKFSLCFICATIPENVRYKHDKHTLTLSFGEQESSTKKYWCEACKNEINLKWRFYKCDDYCCVTLHVGCLIGNDLYLKPGSSFVILGRKVSVLSNNQRMSRPICSHCKRRCSYNIVFEYSGFILCSMDCVRDHIAA